jgi:hypothetical protein
VRILEAAAFPIGDRLMPRSSARWVLPASSAFGLLVLATLSSAAAFDVNLNFASLPSAQGWTYIPSGSHAGAIEGNVFSVSGGSFFQNTIGQSNGVSGGSILYVVSGGVTTTDTKQIRARARCLAVQGSANAPNGEGGFFMGGFATGSVQYGFGITPTRVFCLQPSGTVLTPGTFDNTQFHDWLFDWSPGGSFRIYRDGVLVHTASGGFAVAANRLFFGDGTGGANAQAEMQSLRFIQDVATPAAPASFGAVKGTYRR